MADESEALVTFIAAKLGSGSRSSSAVPAAPLDVNLKVAPPSSSAPAKLEETEQKDLMGLLGDLGSEAGAKRRRCVLMDLESSSAEEPATKSNVTVAEEDLLAKDGGAEDDDTLEWAPPLDRDCDLQEAKADEAEGETTTDTAGQDKPVDQPAPKDAETTKPAEPALKDPAKPAEPALEDPAEPAEPALEDPPDPAKPEELARIPDEFAVMQAALIEELAKLAETDLFADGPCSSWADARRLGLSGKVGGGQTGEETYIAEIEKRSVTTKWDTANVCLKVLKAGVRVQLLCFVLKVTEGDDNCMRKAAWACRAVAALAKLMAEHPWHALRLRDGVMVCEDDGAWSVADLKDILLRWVEDR